MNEQPDINQPLLQDNQIKIVKEPNWLDGFLKSFKSQDNKARQPPMFEAQKDDNNENQKNKEESVFIKEIDIKEQPVNQFFSREFEGQKDKQFFQKASSNHDLPMNQILKTCELKSNPDIFAVFCKSDKQFFQKADLRELMPFDDYKKLEQLRVRNYIQIIKMLYQAYYSSPKKHQKYPIFRKKLLQIKALVNYIDLDTNYKNLYSKLIEDDEQIFIFKIKEKSEEQKENPNRKPIFIDEDDENDNFDSDEEYENYFAHSKHKDGTKQDCGNRLLYEEEKWIKRAQWLEEILEGLKNDEQMIKWYQWFQAKMDCLVDLDVYIKTNSAPQPLDKVFYLYSFLYEKAQLQEHTDYQYSKSQQAEIEQDYIYPKHEIPESEIQKYQNTFIALVKTHTEIREKLCSKILKIELQTDYFLTVYKKKPLGNEKLYEKRINLRNKDFSLQEFMFNTSGEFVYLKIDFKTYETKCNFAKVNMSNHRCDGCRRSLNDEEYDRCQQSGCDYDICKNCSIENHKHEIPSEEGINLIFPLAAKYKDPLLMKLSQEKGQFIFNDHYFIKQDKNKLISYDLNKFKKDPLTIEIQDFSLYNSFQFGSTKEGIYQLAIKNEKEGEQNKNQQMTVKFYNNELKQLNNEYIFDPKDKIGQDYSKVCLNQNGDVIMHVDYIQGKLHVSKFSVNTKNPASFILQKEVVTLEDNCNFESEIEQQTFTKPLKTGFLIFFKGKKDQIVVYKNDQYLTTFGAGEDFSKLKETLSVSEDEEGNLKAINYSFSQNKTNHIQYKQIKQIIGNNKQLEWGFSEKNFQIMNLAVQVCYPYLYFIYNNDQVYMKDLRTENKFYYMNNFMGLQPGTRPLTVFALSSNNKMTFIVPTININYTSSKFEIKVHSIKTYCDFQNNNYWTRYIRFRIFGANQEMFQNLLLNSFSQFFDEKANIDGDIKIVCKSNAIHVEKWDHVKCQSRFILAYAATSNAADRDISNPVQELFYKERACWLFILQRDNEILITSKPIIYQTKDNAFKGAECVFNYKVEDPEDQIYEIVVDSLVKNQISLYVVLSNAQIKRFFTTVQKGSNIEEFQDDPNIYSFEALMKKKEKEGGANLQQVDSKTGGGSGISKKIDLWSSKPQLTIMNKMLYMTPNVIIDFTPIKSFEKIQTGYQLGKPFDLCPGYESNITHFQFSQSDGKIMYQFSFNPIAPMIDQEKGYVSIFTLHLDGRSDWLKMTHEEYSRHVQTFINNTTPGFIIRYFNGKEERIPLTYFGEEFQDIIRFHQSQDGKYLILGGTRITKMVRNEKDEKVDIFEEKQQKFGEYQDVEYTQGIFLYEVSCNAIKLVQQFEYARKNLSTLDEKVQKYLNKQPEKIKTYVEKEFQKFHFNEFKGISGQYSRNVSTNQYYMDVGNSRKEYQYDVNIQLENHDEEMKFKELLLKFEQKEIEEEKKAGKNIWGTLNYTKKSEKELIEMINQDEDYQKLLKKQPNNLHQPCKGFNIPYLPYKARQEFEDEKDTFLINERNNPNYVDEEKPDKNYEDGFDDDQLDFISQMHFNMYMTVNECGNIILLERLHNRLYFFYRSLITQEYSLQKIKFDKDFMIQQGSCSSKYLVIASTNRYLIYNIEKFDQLNENYIELYQNKGGLIYDSKYPLNEKRDDNKINGEEQQIFDSYETTIINLKIKDNILIIRQVDNGTPANNYVLVFDIDKQINKLYIENSKVLISGDKQYIWFVEKNQVVDIINNFSTFFLWPDSQLQFSNCDSMGIFNISKDKSYMVTHGCIYLAFNYMSYHMHYELQQDYQYNFKDDRSIIKNSRYIPYLFFQIGDKKSVLEKIFEDPLNKDPFEKDKKYTNKELDDINNYKYKVISKRMKNLQQFLNYALETCTDENIKNNIGNLFLCFTCKQDLNFGQEVEDQSTLEDLNLLQKMFNDENNVRIDIIEDILTFLLCSDVEIVKTFINPCFLNLLQFGNSSPNIQEYLKQILKQTQKMKEIEKLQISSQEEGFVVKSHYSPIIDNNLQIKLKDQQANSKLDVEVYYTNLGEILNTEGEEIMKTLSDEKYLNMMDIPFIQYLVMFQWIEVRETIKKKLLIPFFILLSTFFIYATFQIDWYRKPKIEVVIFNTTSLEIIDTSTEINSGSITDFIMWLINVVCLALILGYMLYMETKQLQRNKSDYFTDFWNMTDLIVYILCSTVIIMDIVQADIQTIRPIAAICVIILWIKLFYFLRVFETTSRLIRMIIEIVNDMKNFLIVLVIGILGFANGFYIIAQNQENTEEPFAGETFSKAVIYTYRLTLGDFATDDFYNLSGIDVLIVWIIFIFASLFVVIVLLNLLIAMMGDTFGRVLENITNLTIREKVLLISENEALFKRSEIFKNSQYLIVAKEKSLDSQMAENWDGQINALKRQLIDRMAASEITNDRRMDELSQDLKKKFMEFEDKGKKVTLQLDQKVSIVKGQQEITNAQISEMLNNMQQIGNNFNMVKNSINENSEIMKGFKQSMIKFQEQVYENFKIDPTKVETGIKQ